jgi:hypothetical protein
MGLMRPMSDGAGSFSVVLVEDRAWNRRVAALDLWCDDREIPTNLPDTYNHWWGGVSMRTYPEPSNGDELVRRPPARRSPSATDDWSGSSRLTRRQSPPSGSRSRWPTSSRSK